MQSSVKIVVNDYKAIIMIINIWKNNDANRLTEPTMININCDYLRKG